MTSYFSALQPILISKEAELPNPDKNQSAF